MIRHNDRVHGKEAGRWTGKRIRKEWIKELNISISGYGVNTNGRKNSVGRECKMEGCSGVFRGGP